MDLHLSTYYAIDCREILWHWQTSEKSKGKTMKHTGDWAVGGTQTLQEKTAQVLRDALFNQVFKPGDKLVERTLADRTGVSRTSIREALRQLEAEGLVTRESGKGVFVTRLTRTEAAQIYEARAILESATARLFAERATPQALAALDDAIERARLTNRAEDAQLHARRLDEVSDLIMEGAGNEVTRQMSAVLRTRVTFLRTITARVATPERRERTMAMLREISDAFRARDGATAEKLTRQYVERSAAFAIDLLGKSQGEDS